jgi:hypothetical protein
MELFRLYVWGGAITRPEPAFLVLVVIAVRPPAGQAR